LIPQVSKTSRIKRIAAVASLMIAVVLLIPAGFLLLYGAGLLISGGNGFTDAAPWWLVLLLLALGLGIPGLLFLLLSRWFIKQEKIEISSSVPESSHQQDSVGKGHS
jgi:membrane protein implicated in regulation of membrane protease activity